jgi:hypothetical protein
MKTDDYTAIVARGDDNFKLKFAPGSPLLPVDGGRVSMYSVVGQTTKRKWRAWVPPGTCSLQATLFTFSNKEPNAKVLLRMGEPPVGGPDSVTPENGAAVDMANVLAALDQGAEVPCYAPGGVGSVKLSEGRVDSPPVTTVGQWLYINALEVPGHEIFEIVVRVTVDEAAYLAWYDSAVWDDYGNPVQGAQAPAITEQYVLGRLQELDMIARLAALCKAGDDAELISAAKDSGLWAALLKFTK